MGKFNYKWESDNTKTISFVAQDMVNKPRFKSIVKQNKCMLNKDLMEKHAIDANENYLSINIHKLTMYSFSAIKSLIKEIKALKNLQNNNNNTADKSSNIVSCNHVCNCKCVNFLTGRPGGIMAAFEFSHRSFGFFNLLFWAGFGGFFPGSNFGLCFPTFCWIVWCCIMVSLFTVGWDINYILPRTGQGTYPGFGGFSSNLCKKLRYLITKGVDRCRCLLRFLLLGMRGSCFGLFCCSFGQGTYFETGVLSPILYSIVWRVSNKGMDWRCCLPSSFVPGIFGQFSRFFLFPSL